MQSDKNFDHTLLHDFSCTLGRLLQQGDKGSVNYPIIQRTIGLVPPLESHPANACLAQQPARSAPEQHQSRNRAHRRTILPFGHEAQSAQTFLPSPVGGRRFVVAYDNDQIIFQSFPSKIVQLAAGHG